MNWNLSQAQQHLAEIVQQAALEPQLICQDTLPVAAVITMDELLAFRVWKASQTPPPRSLADEFTEARQILAEAGTDGLNLPPREDRENAFLQMLDEA